MNSSAGQCDKRHACHSALLLSSETRAGQIMRHPQSRHWRRFPRNVMLSSNQKSSLDSGEYCCATRATPLGAAPMCGCFHTPALDGCFATLVYGLRLPAAAQPRLPSVGRGPPSPFAMPLGQQLARTLLLLTGCASLTLLPKHQRSAPLPAGALPHTDAHPRRSVAAAARACPEPLLALRSAPRERCATPALLAWPPAMLLRFSAPLFLKSPAALSNSQSPVTPWCLPH
mmetsp:Transcript_83635/g.223691  ORF Transcript_83635/g.223691 Transcript_83635/m.223691 type:complete len:229 (-) Transcript_83635:691-1377(-)